MKFAWIRASALLLPIACTAPDREATPTIASEPAPEPSAIEPAPEPAPIEPAPEPEPALAPEPELTHGRGLARLGTGLVDLAAVCELLRTRECPSIGADDCDCQTGPADEASGFALPTLDNVRKRITVRHPAVRTAAGWAVFGPVVRTRTTGIWGYYEYTNLDYVDSLSLERIDLLPGGEPELVLALEKGHETADNASLPEEATTTWRMRVVCTRDGGVARCTRPLLDEFEFSQDRPEDRFDRYHAEIRLGAEIVVTRVEGQDVLDLLPEALALAAGSHSLAELLAPAPD